MEVRSGQHSPEFSVSTTAASLKFVLKIAGIIK
jgi:hypothetical protein